MDRSQGKRLPHIRLLAQTGDSRSQKPPKQSIAEEQTEHKPQERDFRKFCDR